jgi:hypothetical protein
MFPRITSIMVHVRSLQILITYRIVIVAIFSRHLVVLGGLVVIVLAIGPKVRRFKP